MLRHLPDVLPVFVKGETHDIKDAVELIMVVGVGRLDVLLTAVEDGLRRQQLGEDTPDGPDVDGLGVVAGAQQQLRRSVPERYHHRVKVCEWKMGSF